MQRERAKRASHANGAGRRGPRERACQGSGDEVPGSVFDWKPDAHWNAEAYHRVSDPQVTWGRAVLQGLDLRE